MCGSYILHLFAEGSGASWPPWKPWKHFPSSPLRGSCFSLLSHTAQGPEEKNFPPLLPHCNFKSILFLLSCGDKASSRGPHLPPSCCRQPQPPGCDPCDHTGRALALHITGLLGAGPQDTQGQARQATGRRGGGCCAGSRRDPLSSERSGLLANCHRDSLQMGHFLWGGGWWHRLQVRGFRMRQPGSQTQSCHRWAV